MDCSVISVIFSIFWIGSIASVSVTISRFDEPRGINRQMSCQQLAGSQGYNADGGTVWDFRWYFSTSS